MPPISLLGKQFNGVNYYEFIGEICTLMWLNEGYYLTKIGQEKPGWGMVGGKAYPLKKEQDAAVWERCAAVWERGASQHPDTRDTA